jgi:isoamylase
LLAGDEAGNSQDGNNNTYCQDNEIGWVKWTGLGGDDDFVDTIGKLTRLRQRFPQLKPRRWVVGKKGDGTYDVKWLTPAAEEMADRDWKYPDGRFLSYVLAPEAETGEPLFIVLNGADHPVEVKFPVWPRVRFWQCALDTAIEEPETGAYAPDSGWSAQARAVLAFAGKP